MELMFKAIRALNDNFQKAIAKMDESASFHSCGIPS